LILVEIEVKIWLKGPSKYRGQICDSNLEMKDRAIEKIGDLDLDVLSA
jgi:hypothetical protein